MNFNIATRGSNLAQMQADIVRDMLKEKVNLDCEKLLMDTIGDKTQDCPIHEIKGVGVFVEDVKEALLDGRADLAVHSLKDVPIEISDEFELIAVPERGDPSDVFVSADKTSFYDLKEGATVGTSSLRRRAQIRELRPDIRVVSVRGDIQTRVDKIRTENLDGILIAAAGLKRLGLEDLITDYFNPLEFIPAVGQGALVVETLKNNKHKEIFKKIDNIKARQVVEAERSFIRALKVDHHASVGAYAFIDGDYIRMIGMNEVDGKITRKEIRGKREDYIRLGEDLAKKILEM